MEQFTQLLDLQVPSAIALSPSGDRLLFSTTLTEGHSSTGRPASTLWIAETGRPDSARRLTSGAHYDHAAQWSPDGRTIAFLSDRGGSPGESSAIYAIDGDEADPEPRVLLESPGVQQFAFSPDGSSIAFRSGEDSETGEGEREKGAWVSDDAQVQTDGGSFTALRLLDLKTKEVTTLVGGEVHVADFCWGASGGQILFTSTRNSQIESPLRHGTAIALYELTTGAQRRLSTFRNFVYGIALGSEDAFFLAHHAERKINSAHALYRIALDSQDEGHEKVGFYGRCVDGLRRVGDRIVVKVLDGMEDQLVILDGPQSKPFFARPTELLAWDLVFPAGTDAGVVALAPSDVSAPAEVFTAVVKDQETQDPQQVSSLGAAFAGRAFGTSQTLACPAPPAFGDAQLGHFALDAAFLTPPTGSAPHPTIVLVHGGPYDRRTHAFNAYHYMLTPFLLSHGYAVLLPNYRGSAGKGDSFAAFARAQHNPDNADLRDVLALTDHAVSTGLSDPDRLLIAGWSHGGYIANLAAVLNGSHGHAWRYAAAATISGVSDGDALTLTTDFPLAIAEAAAGVVPWAADPAALQSTSSRARSAIWQFGRVADRGVTLPPLLVLHGAQDTRVPVEQAAAMRRAYKDAGVECQVVLYKGEGHVYWQRRNVVDLGMRLLGWAERFLGVARE